MAMEGAVRDELSYAPEKLEEAEERVRQEDAAAQPAQPEQAQPEAGGGAGRILGAMRKLQKVSVQAESQNLIQGFGMT